MSDDVKRFELTASISVDGVTAENISDYCQRLDSAIAESISQHPGITAYFVQPDVELVEMRVGFRFESVRREFIEDLAGEVLSQAVSIAAKSTGHGENAVREESTLIPA
jgi:hypothetical protein